jgi:hypothetical protein
MTADLADECRRIDRRFRLLGIVSVIVYLAITVSYRVIWGSSALETSGIGSMVFQVLGIVWVVIFMASYLIRMEKKADISLRMGDQAVTLAKKSAETMELVQDEIRPIAADAKVVMADVKEMVAQFKRDDFGKVQAELNKLIKDGTLERILKKIELASENLDQIPRQIAMLAESLRNPAVSVPAPHEAVERLFADAAKQAMVQRREHEASIVVPAPLGDRRTGSSG